MHLVANRFVELSAKLTAVDRHDAHLPWVYGRGDPFTHAGRHWALQPGEAAPVYYEITRSSFMARTSISYSRPTIGGRAKCQVSP